MEITKEEYDKALDIVLKYEEENDITRTWLDEEIEESRNMEDDVERLGALQEMAEHIANDFTFAMGILEQEIEDALDEVSDEAKEETGYHSVEDVTQDIMVRNSNEW